MLQFYGFVKQSVVGGAEWSELCCMLCNCVHELICLVLRNAKTSTRKSKLFLIKHFHSWLRVSKVFVITSTALPLTLVRIGFRFYGAKDKKFQRMICRELLNTVCSSLWDEQNRRHTKENQLNRCLQKNIQCRSALQNLRIHTCDMRQRLQRRDHNRSSTSKALDNIFACKRSCIRRLPSGLQKVLWSLWTCQAWREEGPPLQVSPSHSTTFRHVALLLTRQAPSGSTVPDLLLLRDNLATKTDADEGNLRQNPQPQPLAARMLIRTEQAAPFHEWKGSDRSI